MTGPTPTGPPAGAPDPAAPAADGTQHAAGSGGATASSRGAPGPGTTQPDAAAAARLVETLPRLRTVGWWRAVARMPLLAWRLGLGGVAGRALAVVTTTGQRTGTPRHTVTSYIPAAGRLYVVAVYGPASQWFRNLVADPRVTVQTTGPPRAMRATRVADDDEVRDAYTDLAGRLGQAGADALLRTLGAPGGLDGLLAHRDRVLLVRLDPTEEPVPPPVRADLAWVPPVAAAVALPLTVLAWALRRRGRARG